MSKRHGTTDAEESNRMWARAAFVGVILVIGVPLWWKTTEVYRVSLPYDKIDALHTLPNKLVTRLTVLANDEPTARQITGLVERAFQEAAEIGEVLTFNITTRVLPEELHHAIDSASDEPSALRVISREVDLGTPGDLHLVQRRVLLQDVWVGGERVVLFRDDNSATTIVEALKQWIYQPPILRGAIAHFADAARRTRFPPGDYHITLSVVNPRPDKITVKFDAKQAVEDYIGSFVDELSDIHNFTLKSQWLYLLNFDFQANEVKDTSDWGRHFAVSQERLSLLLTRLEERAATHVSELPTINLALYTVPCNIAPLVIYDNNGKPVLSPVQAFMSPKWGGVVLGNPSANECGSERPEYEPSVRVVMGTFVAQLREMLGITHTEHIQGAHMDPLRSVVPRRWEVDQLLRIRTLEQLVTAKRSLQSLAQMLARIHYIVINDEVGASINAAVDRIHLATELMSSGRLLEAYRVSQDAFRSAETAAMAPSLLELLYFPDDQKYAIYIPLFLPVVLPVVLSLKKLIKWFRGKPTHKSKEE